MSKLKPCPFCGSEVELEKKPLWYGNGRGYKDCYEFEIRCKKCGCKVDQPQNDSIYRSEEEAKKNAIKAWNRRVGRRTDEPEPKWIPCSERLPEEDDYKSCIECLDGAVWYFTENGTMGLGYYYKSTKEWSTTDDLKTDGKVIAWMPLPLQEPYLEEGENR